MIKFIYILFIFIFISEQSFAQEFDSAIIAPTPRSTIVLYESAMGILLTVGTFLPAALLIGTAFEPEGFGDAVAEAFITASLALTLGGSYGVHFVDKKYNCNSSYLLALTGSFVGYGLSYLLLTNNDNPIKGIEAVIAGIAPLAFSIFTVNLIDFQRRENKITINYQPLSMNNILQHNLNIRISL